MMRFEEVYFGWTQKIELKKGQAPATFREFPVEISGVFGSAKKIAGTGSPIKAKWINLTLANSLI